MTEKKESLNCFHARFLLSFCGQLTSVKCSILELHSWQKKVTSPSKPDMTTRTRRRREDEKKRRKRLELGEARRDGSPLDEEQI
jgi:hypothetical protein